MRRLVPLAVAATLGGCVSTNSTPLGLARTSAAVPPASVALYRTADQVGRPYSEVALLNAKGDALFTTEKRMFESMRAAAARIGADGVILESLQEPSAAIKVAAAIFHVSAQRQGHGLAILKAPEQ
jgi:hypothetical protein